MELRPYQQDAEAAVLDSWSSGSRYTLAVLPTGAGKTVLFSEIIRKNQGSSVAIAHRQELVGQISIALARNGVYHRIIGPKNVINMCVQQHISETGRSYYQSSSSCAVAGVQTLIRRQLELRAWLDTVTLWVTDEAHHLVKDNVWGKGVEMFANARGLGVTATPCRADGKGLGAEFDGYFHNMVEGPGMRTLIDMGYLTDYRIFAPPSDLDLDNVKISPATGDFSSNQLRSAVKRSHVMGDVVEHYLKIAKGKLGVTFATDVEAATEISAAFNQAGVPSEVVSAKTPSNIRGEVLRRFKNREIMQLVNVDLFGEGFDLPAIECVSMARPTQSFSLFVQQFGRALRLMEGKTVAIIIDHVGNTLRHGLPDADRAWSLERRGRKGGKSDAMPTKACPECTGVYERIHKECPYCGFFAEPLARDGIDHVDGDLVELNAETLAKMRKSIEKIEIPVELFRERLENSGTDRGKLYNMVNNYAARQDAQSEIKEKIAWWGAWQRQYGRDDSESYRRFYHTFGVDVFGAQALSAPDALKLSSKIQVKLDEFSRVV